MVKQHDEILTLAVFHTLTQTDCSCTTDHWHCLAFLGGGHYLSW